MHPPKEHFMVEPCNICGAHGYIERIVTCSKCKVNREHSYCMRIYTRIIPKDWICEPCKSKGVSNLPRKVNQDMGSRDIKMQRAVRTGKVKFLDEDEVIRLSSGRPSIGSRRVISRIQSLTPTSNPHISLRQVLGNLPRNEIHKKPMTNPFSSSKGPAKECKVENQQPLGRFKHYKKVQTIDDLQKENPTKEASFEALSARIYSPVVGSGGIHCTDVERNQSNDEKSNLQSIQENLIFHQKFLPSSVPAWRPRKDTRGDISAVPIEGKK